MTDFLDLEKALSDAPRTRILSMVKVGAKPHLEELARGRLACALNDLQQCVATGKRKFYRFGEQELSSSSPPLECLT